MISRSASLPILVSLLAVIGTTRAQSLTTIAGTGTYGSSGDGGAATSATLELGYFTGIAVDSSANVYIASGVSQRIRKVTASTGIIDTFAGTGTWGYNGDGGDATSAQLYYPSGVAVDSSGNVYASELSGARIRKVTYATGKISTIAGTGTSGSSGDGGDATSAQLYYPNGVAVDDSGNVYISEPSRYVVRKVTTSTGIINVFAGSNARGSSGDGGSATSAQLSYVKGIAVDRSGNLYIADQGRVRKVSASTNIISTIAGRDSSEGSSGDGGVATSAYVYAYAVATDSSGNVYIGGNDRVRKVTVSTDIITTIAGGGTDTSGDVAAATSAKLSNVYGVAVDSSASVYISDGGSHRVHRVTVSTQSPTTAPTPVPTAVSPTPVPTTASPSSTPAPSNTAAPTLSPGQISGVALSGAVILLHFALAGVVVSAEKRAAASDSSSSEDAEEEM